MAEASEPNNWHSVQNDLVVKLSNKNSITGPVFNIITASRWQTLLATPAEFIAYFAIKVYKIEGYDNKVIEHRDN